MGGGRVREWEREKGNERERERERDNVHSCVHYTCLHTRITKIKGYKIFIIMYVCLNNGGATHKKRMSNLLHCPILNARN